MKNYHAKIVAVALCFVSVLPTVQGGAGWSQLRYSKIGHGGAGNVDSTPTLAGVEQVANVAKLTPQTHSAKDVHSQATPAGFWSYIYPPDYRSLCPFSGDSMSYDGISFVVSTSSALPSHLHYSNLKSPHTTNTDKCKRVPLLQTQRRTGNMRLEVKMQSPAVTSQTKPFSGPLMDNAARMPLATMMLLMMLRSRDGDLQARQWYANMVHQHDERQRHAQEHDLCSTHGLCLSKFS